MYALADRLRRELADGVERICVVTWTGGRLGHAADLPAGADAPTRAAGLGVSGLVKTVAKEWPQRSVRRIDLDPQEPTAAHAAALLPELLDPSGPSEVGHHAGQRLGRRFAPHELVAPDPTALEAADSLALDEQAVVLLTGGARGITARVAVVLAERYRCRLVLVGRSPAPAAAEAPAWADAHTDADLRAAILARGEARAPAEVERKLRRIKAERQMRETFASVRAAGSPLEYHAADVRDADAVRELMDDVYRRYGRLDVVLHGAGVNEDKLLRDKTRESFLRVYDTKVAGAHNLVRGLRADTRAVVFFSSVAGAFGNRGQADYAAANDALDDLARTLDGSITARVVSIGWGPWGGGGMVTPELERQYHQRGVGVIDPVDGVERLLNELTAGEHPQVVLMAAMPESMV
ncbi:MAG: SDR family NAD(P)-dependent oxidoreductase [Myxococcota bacterium]